MINEGFILVNLQGSSGQYSSRFVWHALSLAAKKIPLVPDSLTFYPGLYAKPPGQGWPNFPGVFVSHTPGVQPTRPVCVPVDIQYLHWEMIRGSPGQGPIAMTDLLEPHPTQWALRC